MIDYGIRIVTRHPFEAAVERTKTSLAAEGFGVLTEIDTHETCIAEGDSI